MQCCNLASNFRNHFLSYFLVVCGLSCCWDAVDVGSPQSLATIVVGVTGDQSFVVYLDNVCYCLGLALHASLSGFAMIGNDQIVVGETIGFVVVVALVLGVDLCVHWDDLVEKCCLGLLAKPCEMEQDRSVETNFTLK